jgi:hypothetical protein
MLLRKIIYFSDSFIKTKINYFQKFNRYLINRKITRKTKQYSKKVNNILRVGFIHLWS